MFFSINHIPTMKMMLTLITPLNMKPLYNIFSESWKLMSQQSLKFQLEIRILFLLIFNLWITTKNQWINKLQRMCMVWLDFFSILLLRHFWKINLTKNNWKNCIEWRVLIGTLNHGLLFIMSIVLLSILIFSMMILSFQFSMNKDVLRRIKN